MRVLVVEDNRDLGTVLKTALEKWGHDAILCGDAEEAWSILNGDDPPALAILDWLLPGMNGIEFCQKIRRFPRTASTYVIMLTSRTAATDMVEGFKAGVDDYMFKPFDPPELHARLGAGIRITEVERSLAQRIEELEALTKRDKILSGLLPMCAWCKKVRDDDDTWKPVDEYITLRTDAKFTHGVCEQCAEKLMDETEEEEDTPQVSAPETVNENDVVTLSGSIQVVSLGMLTQSIHFSARTGALRVCTEDMSLGMVYFKDGEIRQAQTEELKGECAYFDMLSWTQGSFSFHADETAPEPNIFRPVMGLLSEGIRRLNARLDP